ncbi:MAG: hypothetical protein KGL39_11370 [Patescibacteria group bacterium]|nr:hypothetical protein [Patescibacteria group bacterium]
MKIPGIESADAAVSSGDEEQNGQMEALCDPRQGWAPTPFGWAPILPLASSDDYRRHGKLLTDGQRTEGAKDSGAADKRNASAGDDGGAESDGAGRVAGDAGQTEVDASDGGRCRKGGAMRGLAVVAFLAGMLAGSVVSAQTLVTDSVTYTGGGLAAGSMQVCGSAGCTNSAIYNGTFAVALSPGYYTVSYSLSNGSNWNENWLVYSSASPLNRVNVLVQNSTSPSQITLGGDVTGPVGSNTATALQGNSVCAGAPGAGWALTWNGSCWSPAPMMVTTLTDGPTVTWTVSGTSRMAKLTFTTHGSGRTLVLAGSPPVGTYSLILTQDSTGGEALVLGSGCTWKVASGGGGAVTLSFTANAIDVLTFQYDGAVCYAQLAKNFT